MKVVFMGTPDFAVTVLQGLIDNYEVVGVVSQPDKRVGRHQELVNTPIKEVALLNIHPIGYSFTDNSILLKVHCN